MMVLGVRYYRNANRSMFFRLERAPAKLPGGPDSRLNPEG